MRYLDCKTEIKLCDETPILRTESCSKEPETIQWIEEYVKPEDTFVDIGANIGAYSFIAAQYCSKVYAFEPAVSNFYLLLKNITLNNLRSTIKPFPFPLGEYDGLTYFRYKDLEFGSTHDNLQGTILHPIQQFRLDTLFHNGHIKEPTHIKCDVDGQELIVLNGMTNILKEYSPKSLQIECSSHDRVVQQWLTTEYNYVIEKQTVRNNKDFSNVLFIRRDISLAKEGWGIGDHA